MAITICENCEGIYEWDWRDAFLKFGFNNGMSQVETFTVAEVLQKAGYIVQYDSWDTANVFIHSIKKDKCSPELIPHVDNKVFFGYDDPRSYLPKEIVELLDRELSTDSVIQI